MTMVSSVGSVQRGDIWAIVGKSAPQIGTVLRFCNSVVCHFADATKTTTVRVGGVCSLGGISDHVGMVWKSSAVR